MTSQTYRIFSKKHPGIESLYILQNTMVQKYINNPTNLRNRVTIDIQKSIIIHNCISAGLETSKIIDTNHKENISLIFEVGLVYYGRMYV